MHQVVIKLPDSAYHAAKQTAERRGFLSVEEYVSDRLEHEATTEISMTPALAAALEERIADSRAGRVITLDEHNRRHAALREQWIQAQAA